MVRKAKRIMRGNELIEVWLSIILCGCLLISRGVAVSAAPNYTIKLVSGEFTPNQNTDAMGAVNQGVQQLGTIHVLIQFYNVPDDVARRSMANAGITLLDPIPENAWVAAISQPLSTAKVTQFGIRWLGSLGTVDKIHPRVLRGEFGPWTEYEDNKIIVTVRLFADVAASWGENLAGKYNAVTGDYIPILNTWVMAVNPDDIDGIASEDPVQWVDVLPPPMTAVNDVARQVVGANTVQAAPYNLNGSGITVCVYDAGMVDPTHNDFAGRIVHSEGSSVVIDHSTHVAGSVGGSGVNSGGQYRGMAPGCSLLSYAYESCSPYCLYNSPQDIAANYSQAMNTYNARIATNSIGSNTAANGYPCSWEGDYELTSQLLDNIVRGSLGSPFIVAFAAGNERGYGTCGTAYSTLGVPAGAKNVISVGATDDYDDMTYFSSWGPTDDGRIKPEVCAPGLGIHSTLPGNTYGDMSGTSMATPITSGCIALILEQYADSYPGLDNPLPSTIKAILINTAVDLGNAGPDYQYGFGRVNVQAAVDAVIDGDFLEDELATGQSNAHAITVPPGTSTLRVSLAWADPAAAPNANPTLVNDLDLTLVSPSITTYHPYILNPASPSSPATTGTDHANNYEQVVVASPQAGQWTINVSATSLPTSPQSYSLAASEALEAGFSFIEGDVTAQGTGDPLQATVRIVGGSQQVTAGPDGHYRMGVVGDATYTIEASYFGYVPSQQSIYVPLGTTVTRDFTLSLAPVGTMQGTVYDVASNPVSGAEITMDDTPLDPVYSNASGFYQNSQIPGGASYSVTATATGFGGTTDTVFVPAAGTVTHNFTLNPIVFMTNFESGTTWTMDPSHTASTGAFVAIDPNPTDYQPDDDTTPPPGVMALVTAQNSSLGVDDVDNGVAATRSPIVDLSGYVGARLIMNWFFGQRDEGGDPGDFFRIDVSNDGGASYPVNLISIGDVNHPAIWHTLDVELQTVITLTSQMRIRVQAADGTAIGDIVEAGIDDVEVIGYVAGAPPQITDVTAVRSGDSILLGWSDPGGGVTFNVYRSTDPAFVPTPGDLIANVAVPNYSDTDVLLSSDHYFYRVTAVSATDASTASSHRQPSGRNVR
jgi:hypothetical protein